MADEILTEVKEQVGIIRLNRPKALNALTLATMEQVAAAVEQYDRDPVIRCILLTGNEKAFAAGVDIKEMADVSMMEMYYRNQFADWERIARAQKPIVAAVSGYALGGGCELMMACDIVVAAESARFGQPEVKLGLIPGAGGTQRMSRAIGKAQAMDLILTGRMLKAQEALAAGLVSRVVPDEACFDEAFKVCQEICKWGPIAVRFAKEAVDKAFEAPLLAGLHHERKLFYMLFGTEDAREGMAAFVEKRAAAFKGK
ncbi:MAG: enoyl-CoA hydratase/isomerase family protein [Planctomycetes bacterium]|nr:enoyl-CoA hydratase/isomerase family protein [Planctomycetota bacterium]